ncbi:Protein FYV4 [Yarrowia sp. C11]|nr:Protein FYV4 [Yarrowia sp. C11]KAG5371161.1 Protein FYV4 [Yarrowia sp. E02]
MLRVVAKAQYPAAVRCFSTSHAAYAQVSFQSSEDFLKKIGRDTVKLAEKFETWDELKNSTSSDLKEKGIEARERRYIMSQLHRYKNGEPIREIPRGKKTWGGERKRNLVQALFKAGQS